MQAIHRAFTKIINGTTQFVIPVFQRDYTWTETQCEQLWADVQHIARDPADRGHFLGSIVYVATGDGTAGFTRWLLIDGQQRVTTLLLLMIALRDHIIETGWKGQTEESPDARRIDAYFLKNVHEDGPKRPKLVLRRHDQEGLRALLESDPPGREASERIRDNYEFFREQLADADPDVVYRGIGRLIVVDVTLDRGVDDPQLIFESLNSTGIDLSQADLIRNFVLMRLPERDQTKLYETYWSRIEDLFRGSERSFDGFVRDYLALRTRPSKQEKADSIYRAFQREFGALVAAPEKVDEFLKDLFRFAGYYAAFSVGGTGPAALREALARLRKQVDVPGLLVMRLFACHEGLGALSEKEFLDSLTLLESYVFRRSICGLQTRGYWQVFATLAYNIDESHPYQSLKVGLARLRESYRYPGDDEFRKSLEEGDTYGKRACFELLSRLENHESKEPVDTSRYSIEHIMPQNDKLHATWREMLGDGWRDVQRTWLHRLGNLTLTGYNSSYSDRPFEEKKTIKRGFTESALHLNRFVREQRTWTEREMDRRGRILAENALAIWPPLVVDRALVAAATQVEIKAQAARRDVAKVRMTSKARDLFELLRTEVKELDDNIIEMAEEKSVSYHAPDFFMEVLPRKHRLSVLLALEFGEIDDPTGIAKDAAERDFFVNAVYDGGVNLLIKTAPDIDRAMPLIRQAHASASASN